MRQVSLAKRTAFSTAFFLEHLFPNSQRVKARKADVRARIIDHVRRGGTGRVIEVDRRKDLTPEDDEALKKYAQSVILKSTVHSPERLLSETALFLHRVESELPERSKAILDASRQGETSIAGRKVLVVDDDVRNIFAMTSVLEASGLEVIYTENGQAAIEALTRDPGIDVVLMDVMMPGMDGYETMRAIRANPIFRGIPIVAITAKALKDDRNKCLEAGASDYLPKPVDTDKLLDLIRRWTGGGEGVALQ